MARYQVQIVYVKNGQSARTTRNYNLEANSESEARSIAREKAEMDLPDCKITVGSPKKIS